MGDAPNKLFEKFNGYSNIIFKGRIPYKDIPALISKAEYGINYIPDKAPYNKQTSTKLMEYMALGLKIVTTNYQWVNNFETQTNSRFYKMQNDNINMEEIEKFEFRTNFSEDYSWRFIIDSSKIEDYILAIYKENV